MASAAIAGGLCSRATAALTLAQVSAGASKQARIADVQVWPVSIQQKVPIKIALGSYDTAENVWVRLRTADGVVGWGEASPYSRVTGETQASAVAMAKKLVDCVKGRDRFTLPKIIADMDALTPGDASIKSAFEMAVWDISGKIAGQPVVSLLGQFRESFPTDRTIFIDTPSAMAELATQNVGMGFKTVKVKVGEAPDLDIERVRSVRAAVSKDIALRIDAKPGLESRGRRTRAQGDGAVQPPSLRAAGPALGCRRPGVCTPTLAHADHG